jgi:enoyl-[acyl-carrier protein] reductase I
MKLGKKKILVIGMANKQSIAWGVIQQLKAQGAEVGVCYFHDSNKKRVQPLAEELGCSFIQQLDVTKPEEIDQLAALISEKWMSFDGFVHSIAFAPASSFEKRFHETDLEEFNTAMNISAFSLVALAQKLKPLFAKNFSIASMTYNGANQVLPGYNVMGVAKAALESITRYLAEDLGKDGVRVNCISPGPIKTMAAFGVPNFSHFLDEVKAHSPLRENITIEDVGNMAAFLMSDDSKMMTGQIMYLDSGMSVLLR